MGVVIGIIAAYFLGYIGSMMSYESIDITAGVSRMIENLKELQLLYPFNTGMILGIINIFNPIVRPQSQVFTDFFRNCGLPLNRYFSC